METNEDRTGSRELAEQLGCKAFPTGHAGNAVKYELPPAHGNSWIQEISAGPGFFATDVYCRLLLPVVREYHVKQSCLWICSFYCGEVTVVEKGKKARRLNRGIHLMVNRDRPFKVIYGSSEPLRYTGMLVSEEFLIRYLQGRFYDQPFSLSEAAAWKGPEYNTPELTLIFEQIKYAVRCADVPSLFYEGKLKELLAVILRNVRLNWYWRRYRKEVRRKNWLTYQNEQYMWRVKAELDKDILNPPDISQLTVIAEMGSTKLRQCFKQCYGLTVAAYLQQERMKYAMRLLSHDDMSIQNIARTVGYENPGKFTAAFKKVHGVTPSAVRKSFAI